MIASPDRLYADADDRKLYEHIEREEGIFKNTTRKEQFLFAMGIGVKNGAQVPLDKKDGLFFTKDLKPDDLALIAAVAMHATHGVSVMGNAAEIFRIAEEYAHGGIRLLFDRIANSPFGTYEKQLEKDLVGLYNKLFPSQVSPEA